MDENREIVQQFLDLPQVIVVCGHYGTGKTNFSLNLAYDLAQAGRSVTLVDLDIVNPYFRSSEHQTSLAEAGIELLCPQSANTALDAPMLSVAVNEAIEAAQSGTNSCCIIDAGGDDVGATALGRYARQVTAAPYAMLYIVNAMRDLTRHAADAASLLREIEAASHLRATHIVNNTHLMDATDDTVIASGISFAEEAAQLLALPLLCTAIPLETQGASHLSTSPVPSHLEQSIKSGTLTCENPYYVRIYVKKPWE